MKSILKGSGLVDERDSGSLAKAFKGPDTE
jgi:hypothetical protein